MNAESEDLSRRSAKARSPRTAAADLEEVDQIIERVLVRYPLAHDVAYSAGGGVAAVGASRGDLQHSHPTEDVATSVGKDIQRHRVARVGKKIGRLVKLAREIDADLAPQTRSRSRQYDQAWLASSADPLPSDAELGEQLRKQAERARRGEL